MSRQSERELYIALSSSQSAHEQTTMTYSDWLASDTHATTTTTTVLWPFVRDHPGEPVPEETFTQTQIVRQSPDRTCRQLANTATTPQPFYGPFFWDHPGEPVPEENFWTLWCKGRLTQADTPTIRLGATPSGLTSAHLHHPTFFYRPDALPAA